jgi:hypothetical protein
MSERDKVERNTILRLAAFDNDIYSITFIEQNTSLKIYDDLGLGSARRSRCSKYLNQYIVECGGTKVKKSDLIKKSDTVLSVIDRVEEGINNVL